MATDRTPQDFVCQCLEQARPLLDTRGYPEYTHILGGTSMQYNDRWDAERHEIAPDTIMRDLGRLHALIAALENLMRGMAERQCSSANYSNMDRARKALCRLRDFESLIREVMRDG
jgi:hypothetical protein